MTKTQYTYRWIIFVAMNKAHVGNNWAKQWDPDVGGEYTFGAVRLSADGQEPATHTVCNTAATHAMTNGIKNALVNTPFAALYDVSEGWTWEAALADTGLQVIQKEM